MFLGSHSAFIVKRVTWAGGMIQVERIDCNGVKLLAFACERTVWSMRCWLGETVELPVEIPENFHSAANFSGDARNFEMRWSIQPQDPQSGHLVFLIRRHCTPTGRHS